MSPPEDGGYLTVRRFEDAEVREEYIPLTEDQEKEITGSNEIIDPVMYGIDGITYAASQEIYESKGWRRSWRGHLLMKRKNVRITGS